MTYRNIMVPLNPASSNHQILRFTAELAARFGAKVIGVAASCPFPVSYSDSLAAVTAAMITEAQEGIARATKDCEEQFRSAMQGWVKEVEWRHTRGADSVLGYLVKEARAADLIVANRHEVSGNYRLSLGELAMRAGRPILVVPKDLSRFCLRRVAIAWKDEREARRAIVDALPLLKLAQNCTTVEVTVLDDVGPSRRRLEDVTSWLASHGVSSEVLSVGTGGAQSQFLADELRRLVPDLVVAGAYGHNRLAEWVFGGVTRDLLVQSDFCALISH